MSAKKKLLAGGKFNRRHQTLVDAAEPVIKAAKDCDFVTKISLGTIKPSGPGIVRVKFVTEDNCVRVQVRGTTAVQTLRLYVTDAAAAIAEIRSKLDNAG